MGDEIAFENGRISEFEGLVTLTLTLDRVIPHTIMHQSSTATYVPNFIEIKETMWTDGRTGERTFETDCITSTRRSRPKNFLPEDSSRNSLTKVGKTNIERLFATELCTTCSSIERTAGSGRPQSSQTADIIAVIEDTVTMKLWILQLFCRVFVPISADA